MYTFTKLIIVLCIFAKGSLSDSSWTYSGPTGPDHWCELDLPGNSCCGQRQSPILIDESTATLSNYYIDIQGLHIDWATISLKNDAHTVVLRVPSDADNQPRLNIYTDPNQPPSDTYLFDTLHFHFGNNATHGSEHLINSQPRPMEMHVVFYNEKYGSFDASKCCSDGIVVVGVQFEVGKSNDRWGALVSSLLLIPWYEQETTIDPGFQLRHLLPSNLDDSFNYVGSLTTPACNEAVTWFVLTDTVQLSEGQFDHFRLLHNVTQSESKPKLLVPTETMMFNNYRPTQNLNGRTVYRQNAAFVGRMKKRITRQSEKTSHGKPRTSRQKHH